MLIIVMTMIGLISVMAMKELEVCFWGRGRARRCRCSGIWNKMRTTSSSETRSEDKLKPRKLLSNTWPVDNPVQPPMNRKIRESRNHKLIKTRKNQKPQQRRYAMPHTAAQTSSAPPLPKTTSKMMNSKQTPTKWAESIKKSKTFNNY